MQYNCECAHTLKVVMNKNEDRKEIKGQNNKKNFPSFLQQKQPWGPNLSD